MLLDALVTIPTDAPPGRRSCIALTDVSTTHLLAATPAVTQGEIVDFAAPLLGDQVRRGCASESLASRAPEAALRRALLAAETVSRIPLEAMEASATSTVESQSGEVAHQEGAAVVEDEAEKLAMMAGFAEHLEADFWGVDDDGDDDDDEYW